MWRCKQDSEARFCLAFAELKQQGLLFFTWGDKEQRLYPEKRDLISDLHINLGAQRDRPLVQELTKINQTFPKHFKEN